MLTCLLKRVLPFLLTLMVGVMLGGLIGQVQPRPNVGNNVWVGRGHKCGAGRYSAYRYQNWGNTTPLEITFKPQPLYTEEARRDGITGVVKLRMVLGKDGTVSDIETVRGLPDGLTDEAISAARGITFIPARVGGEPVDTTQVVEFRFDGN